MTDEEALQTNSLPIGELQINGGTESTPWLDDQILSYQKRHSSKSTHRFLHYLSRDSESQLREISFRKYRLSKRVYMELYDQRLLKQSKPR